MSTDTSWFRLPDLGVLRVAGPDARSFLQGQLSNDVQRLDPETVLYAGLHNAQGRVIAFLQLAAVSETELLVILPAELLEKVARHLQRYVLRAKLQLRDVGHELAVCATLQLETAALRPPLGPYRLPAPETRAYGLWPLESAATLPAASAAASDAWHAQNIAAGLPRVTASTSEQFVAQMLNLDCIGAISFDKGCYTGQEIIARAHYRGHVKRRMQGFSTESAATLEAGQQVLLHDGRGAVVIDARTRTDGHCDFLAVETAAAAGALPVRVIAQPLPYALPD
jgi:hypothetical protein